MQTLVTSHPTSSSTIRPPAKKKGFVIQFAQMPPNPPHASPHSALTFASSSSATNTEPDAEIELLATNAEPKAETELVVPSIICEEEGEKDMVANLRTRFKGRQCQCLSESIMVAHTKKACMEVLCLEPISAIVPALEPSATTAGTNLALDGRPFSVGTTIHPKLWVFSIGSTQLSDDSVEYVASVLPRP